ncbi:MAG: ribbon-helix-helix domain-containing protein [Desulfurococcales archaeon]|nr:ribbon-helix-helix domain-containing protein [Desulfurococcales archaeon]
MRRDGPKRRFGISIRKSLADELDMLASVMGVDRSVLVEEAISWYLDDHRHLLGPHHCRGIIAAVCPDNREVADVVRRNREIILGHFHLHLDGLCIDIFSVSGESEKIARALGSLKGLGCRTRFIPAEEEGRIEAHTSTPQRRDSSSTGCVERD